MLYMDCRGKPDSREIRVNSEWSEEAHSKHVKRGF
jgi:hypothetical protein